MSDQASPAITIDGKTYDLNSLSEATKAQLVNVQTVDRKITELQQDIAIMQTARAAYARELTSALKNERDREKPLF
ncbi:DUF6447 family protein [Mesorhizobium sp. A556]